MRISRLHDAWSRPGPSPARAEAVAEIVERVAREKDAALIELTETFDGVTLTPERLRVGAVELSQALTGLDAEVRQALETAIANVRSVADAQLRDVLSAELPQGQLVEIAEVPVRRAGVYVPGGRAPYPSTVVMGAVTARSAGVDQVVVCAPPGPDGEAHPVILGACALCGVDEVYRVGGAQAIAALAYGTETVEPVEVVAGPGNAWVTEAKRQVYGQVGIDGLAGPSELVVLASSGADPELVALDLLAQAEHGEDSPLWLISPDEALVDAVIDVVERLAPGGPRRERRASGDHRRNPRGCARLRRGHRAGASRAGR